jgi:UrcA family protein
LQNHLATSLLIKTEISAYLKGRSPHFPPKETTMTKFIRFSLLLSAFVAAPTLAQSVAPAPSRVVVTTADLDLGSKAGQGALDRRLAHAVIEACGTTSDADLAGQNDVRRCREQTSAAVAARRDRLVQLASKGSPILFASR